MVFVSLTALFWYRPRSPCASCAARGDARSDLALAALYLLISTYAVLQPGGPFSHYLNLLLQPYALLFMLIFCRLAKAAARPALVWSAYLGLTVLLPTIGVPAGSSASRALPTLDSPHEHRSTPCARFAFRAHR